MCIIAAIQPTATISKETLKRCWDNNPHGGGFTYTDGKRVQVVKEMSSFKRLWKSFVECRELFPKSTFIVHFRISTHGKINEVNCHPFKVSEQISFAHNGIIRNSSFSNDFSDTVMFNTEILQQLPKNFLENKVILRLVEEYIGSGSKLAFLTWDNTLTLVNEKAGTWDAETGVWFSNTGYKQNKYYDAGGTKVSTVGGTKDWNYFGSQNAYFGSSKDNDAIGKGKGKDAVKTAAISPQINLISDCCEVKPKIQPTFVDWNARQLENNRTNWREKVLVEQKNDDCCVRCDTYLATYYEKYNKVCTKCEAVHTDEWMF
jgi:predicted glutamine amidotransferase